ncbi:MAG: VWA domain-containing protein [Bdellovibrionaceae bacterium]|nr:VWA domain-containing protein [Pseudobdellovibrionaceae bacterium]MDW8189617.1 VWA domain-containing protein [Pseudobdellovibrionaceae bacterium]
MRNLEFAHIWVLLGVPIVLSLLYFRYYLRVRQYSSFVPFSSFQLIPNSQKQHLNFLLKLLPVGYMVGLSLFLVALARPQKHESKIHKNVEGIDIMITLDISDSMLIEDMKPLNRLEAAKQTIIDFVKGREHDRIGIVIFAGEAFTLVPLTLDYDLIQNRVAELTTAKDARIKDGTALGVALANAAARLKDSTAKTRVIIFLTDGENNSGTIDPETGLEIAKGYGLRIYSIGLGRSGPTRIPIYSKDVFGNKVKHYQPFVSTVNEPLLKRMADETGGKFFSAYDEKVLHQVFEEINRLEKSKIEVHHYTKIDELYMYPLRYGLMLLFLTLFVDFILLRRFPVW